MPERLTQEFVKKFLLDRNIKLHCEYKNSVQKLDVECLVCGRDGEQHYKEIKFFGGQKSLEKTQQRDQLKNKLISEHLEDVKTFIRIPYWESITEENIRRILKENGVNL